MSTDLSQITGEQYLQMSEPEKLRVLTNVYRQIFHEDVKVWSERCIDIVERLGINDYEQGTSKIEIPLGFLRCCSVMLSGLFVKQNRQELQCYSEDTQFAAQLSETIYDKLSEISAAIEDTIMLQSYYTAALMHRKESKAHLLNADGEAKPYSPEELTRDQLIKEQSFNAWREDLREKREELEAAYWGEAEMPPLPEDCECIQTVMPLWSAGFAEV